MDLSSDIKLYFLGTGSQKPSSTRNVTSVALVLESGHYLLFDCGEGTQHQILKSNLSLSNLDGIFITHLHGDHIFGLPGLLCSLNDTLKGGEFTIHGPTGLREFIKLTLFNKIYCVLQYRLNIVEFSSTMQTQLIDRAILIEGKSRNEENYVIRSFPVLHTREDQGNTYGYVIKQHDQKIKFKDPTTSGLFSLLEINKDQVEAFIKEKTGKENQNYRSVLGLLQNSSEDLIIQTETGEHINIRNDERYIEVPKRGICICLIIDSANSSRALEALGELECDILVHESTNAKTSLDGDKSYKSIETETLSHGHSTPNLAGLLAKQINVKQLILTHFSARYKGDLKEQSLAIMEEIRQAAISTFENPNVITARDLMEINLHQSVDIATSETNRIMSDQIGKIFAGGSLYNISYCKLN